MVSLIAPSCQCWSFLAGANISPSYTRENQAPFSPALRRAVTCGAGALGGRPTTSFWHGLSLELSLEELPSLSRICLRSSLSSFICLGSTRNAATVMQVTEARQPKHLVAYQTPGHRGSLVVLVSSDCHKHPIIGSCRHGWS